MSHPFPIRVLFLGLCLAAAACGPGVTSDPEVLSRLPERIDFNVHVKPILSDRCFACHGPDENAREADLRLYVEEGAKEARLESGGLAIVPGSLRRSEAYRRIRSGDPERVMPPPRSNLTLTEYEKALIGRWIQQGAEWKPHWAFTPPVKAGAPGPGELAGPAVNEIDHFVRARLEREGLVPSPEADRERLIRRVSFDLTGMPPSLEEIDAFLLDESDDAYEKVVDRLLASDAFGERMAADWMDVSRYADSHGYHADGYRMMWPWRDWVIRSFNENMPFDEFVVWQIAGDLLPGARRDQILATGFNRNHPMTAEGGAIDAEYRAEYVADRVNTAGRAFLGLTMECARCHDHKYDPISQKEYYQFAAFFNSVEEVGMTGDDGNAGPLLMLPDEEQEGRIEAIRAEIAALEARLEERARDVMERVGAQVPVDPPGLVAHYPLDVVDGTQTPNLAGEQRPAAIAGEPDPFPGRDGSALRFDHDFAFLSLDGVGGFERYDPFSYAIWLRPERREHYQEIFGNAGDKNTYWRGYEMYLDSLNRVSARLIHALPHNVIHVTTVEPVSLDEWSHVALTYDGSSRASGLRLYLNGREADVTVHVDRLYKSIVPVNSRYERIDRSVRVAKSYRSFSGDNGNFKGAIDDIRIYDRTLTSVEVARLAGSGEATVSASSGGATAVTAMPPAGSTSAAGLVSGRTDQALEHYLHRSDRVYQTLLAELRGLRVREHELVEEVPEVMVMEEMETPRRTYVLERGLYDAPREEVGPGVPEHVLPFPEDLPRNRLGLARWLVSPENPLTARVTVNRYWQLFFGRGIVDTPDDFGNQGSLPEHPEMLDWLAVFFVESGWDVKALHKKFVMSATYRQTSAASRELLQRDPENRLLARAPRYRLDAEMIRDNALAASGLLVRELGGPSVKPYQPEGLWEEKGEFSAFLLTYEPDSGDALYRRSLYTFLRRTSPHPSMTAFDAPDRNVCTVERQRTNTPLQALVLLNDPQYVEAARVLAERMIREGGPDLSDRVTLGFRLLSGRRPMAEELSILGALYREERERFETRPTDATEMLSVGEYPRDARLDPVETAALAVVAGVMMNLDDAYMKR